MKRKLLMLLVLALALLALPLCASAAASCPDHPKAGTKIKWKTKQYVPVDEKKHTRIRTGAVVCKKCQKELESAHEEKEYEHLFKDGVCLRCGFVSDKKITSKSVVRSELLRQNIRIGENAVGKYAKARYGAYVYSSPDYNASVIGLTQAGKQYEILGFQQNGVSEAFFQISFEGREGWAGANKLSVVDYYVPENGVCDVHPGATITLLPQYDNAILRAGPGTRHDVMTSVRPGETYTVLACYVNGNGIHWAKIAYGQKEGWVAMGRFQVQ